MTKCDYCFIDAKDQKCSACGAAACNKHLHSNGTCSSNHDALKAPAIKARKEEEPQDETPRPKRRSSRG